MHRQRRRKKYRRRKYTLEEKKKYANKLRKKMTLAEVAVWKELKGRQGVIRAQYLPQVVVCGYIPDFVELNWGIVVEIDGPIHKYQKERDRTRTENLTLCGYEVLRFSNEEALEKTEWVVTEMLSLAPPKKLSP